MAEEISVMVHDRDAFNIQLDNGLKIIYIHPTCTENKYNIGDRLIQVDGVKVSSLQELPEHLICRAHFRTARLVFCRNAAPSVMSVGKFPNQEDVVKFSLRSVREYPALSSTVVNFDMEIMKNNRLGLVLKEKGPNVYVYRTVDCSLSSLYFFAGDKILEMNGHRISSTENAKKLFLKHFENGKPIRISVERPEGVDQMLANALAMNFGEHKMPSQTKSCKEQN